MYGAKSSADNQERQTLSDLRPLRRAGFYSGSCGIKEFCRLLQSVDSGLDKVVGSRCPVINELARCHNSVSLQTFGKCRTFPVTK